MSAQLIFIIEHCENCSMHGWNTRHDANKYKQSALNTAEAIKKSYPGCEVVFNMVPKVWAHSDIYCQLIPNEDEAQPYYEVVPRIGTFEVSVNGVLLFSKLLSGLWPNFPAVGERCKQVAEAIMRGEDPKDFQTTGFGQKAARKSRGGMGSTAQSFAPAQQQQQPVAEAPQEPAPVIEAQPEPVAEVKQAEAPKEEPKAEALKVEEKKEELKTEAPKVEEKKAEAPKVEEKKVEAPKVEEKKAEAPKVEEKKAEAPKVEEKKAEAPKVDAKAADPKAPAPAAAAKPADPKPEAAAKPAEAPKK